MLETIGKITAACFDKTGTLTEGKPKVTDVLAGDLSEDEVLRLAASWMRAQAIRWRWRLSVLQNSAA